MTLPRVEVCTWKTLEPLLEILWAMLPNDYTGGGTFIQEDAG